MPVSGVILGAILPNEWVGLHDPPKPNSKHERSADWQRCGLASQQFFEQVSALLL